MVENVYYIMSDTGIPLYSTSHQIYACLFYLFLIRFGYIINTGVIVLWIAWLNYWFKLL